MYPSPKILTGLAAAVALALPASAGAHERASVKSVKTHLAQADQALQQVTALVAEHDQAAAAVAFARNRLEMRRAQAETARVKASGKAAAALQAVARQQDTNSEAFVGLVDDATGDMQVQVAKGAAASVKGRDKAIAQLSALAERLPEPARAAIARAMSAVLDDAADDAEAISETLASPDVSELAKPWLQLAIAQATAGITTAMTQLQGLLPLLPAPAQAPVQQALDTVTGVLGMVNGILEGIFGGAGDSSGPPVPAGLPVPGKLPIPHGLPIPFGIGG